MNCFLLRQPKQGNGKDSIMHGYIERQQAMSGIMLTRILHISGIYRHPSPPECTHGDPPRYKYFTKPRRHTSEARREILEKGRHQLGKQVVVSAFS